MCLGKIGFLRVFSVYQNLSMGNDLLTKLSAEKPAPAGTIKNPGLAKEVLDAFERDSTVGGVDEQHEVGQHRAIFSPGWVEA